MNRRGKYALKKKLCRVFLYLFKYMHQSNPWLKMSEIKACKLLRNSRQLTPKCSHQAILSQSSFFFFFRNSFNITTLILKPTHSFSGRNSEMHHQTWLLTYLTHTSLILNKQSSICYTYLCMRLVSGSINFFPSLGSNGVRAPNYFKKYKQETELIAGFKQHKNII